MKVKNIVIYVSKSGRPYNRTDGRNDPINVGKRYPVGSGGTVEFTMEDGGMYVTKFAASNKQGYRTKLERAGLYIVTGFCVMPLPNTPKEVRILYNKIKSVFGKVNFSISDNKDLSVPFKVTLFIVRKFTTVEPRFTIKINSGMIDPETMDAIEGLLARASTLDYRLVASFSTTGNETDTCITLNHAFIDNILEKMSIQQNA